MARGCSHSPRLPLRAQNHTLLSNVDRLMEKACAAEMTAGL